MKTNSIRIEAFCHEGDLSETNAALVTILPKDIKAEKEILEPEGDGGVFKEPLIVLRARIEKSKEAQWSLERLRAGMSSADISMLRSDIPGRIDDSCSFYLRLDRDALARGGDNAQPQGYCARKNQAGGLSGQKGERG